MCFVDEFFNILSKCYIKNTVFSPLLVVFFFLKVQFVFKKKVLDIKKADSK